MQTGMIKTYETLVRAGRRTLESVPETLRRAVKEALDEEDVEKD